MASQGGDTVLVAIDASHYSEEAFHWYIDHMHKPGNKVTLVHCMEMPAVPSRDTWDLQTKAGKEKGEEIKSKFLPKLQANEIEANLVMDFEKPGEFICSVAKKEEATVIIMGTRGMGKIRRTILGSVSDYVINHANCPVLVCRAPKD